MRETYLRPSQISKIMSHIENPNIERTVYLDIFRHIQGHTKLFSHVQPYSGTFKVIQPCSAILRDSKVYLGIFRRYSHMPNNLGGQLPFFSIFCQLYALIMASLNLLLFSLSFDCPQLIVHPFSLNGFQERRSKKNVYSTPIM